MPFLSNPASSTISRHRRRRRALAVALSDYTVRDACISTTAGDHAQAAERLWIEPTRQCAAPQRMEPAVLPAIPAHPRRNGVLASPALDRAQTASPTTGSPGCCAPPWG
ncbi:DUF4192 family protein [Saccharothrix syringae]|uniref:DUF4192 family protein n=1 Tax=Saccharothrix syringae TaxID=103733 RepID=UPI001B805C08